MKQDKYATNSTKMFLQTKYDYESPDHKRLDFHKNSFFYNFIRVNTFHSFGRAARSSQLIIATHKIFYLALL